MSKEIIIQSFGLGAVKTKVYEGFFKAGEKDKPLSASRQLGTPVFSSLKMKFEDEFSDSSVTLETVLISLTQAKNIVTTAVQGRNGTVKEYVSDGDFVINVKGVITGSNGKYPSDEARNLTTVLREGSEVDVICPYLQFWNINKVVITDFALPQTEGSHSQQLFEFNALSDDQLEVIL